MKTTVLLADDHTIVREALRMILESAPDFEVVASVENGKKAIEMAKKLQPEVILLDLMMPVLNGKDALRDLVRALPRTKIIILSSYCDEQQARECIAEGAAGYLVKQTAGSELLQAITETRRGNVYFSASISRNVVEQGRNCVPSNRLTLTKPPHLTARETEVFQLIAEGLPNKGIAAELGISIKTVEKHRQQVMNKLNIHHIAGITRHAISLGLIRKPEEPKPLEPVNN